MQGAAKVSVNEVVERGGNNRPNMIIASIIAMIIASDPLLSPKI
jgi:hypothetical protein